MLSHPLRDRLLFEYQDEASPSQVARRTGERLNVVSYHTRVLARHGYLELVRTERRKGATARFYRSSVNQVVEGAEWASLPAAVRRALIRESIATVTGAARSATLSGGFDGEYAHLTRSLLKLDEQGVAEAERVLRGVVDELAAIEAASLRLRGTTHRTYEVVIMGFETAAGA